MKQWYYVKDGAQAGPVTDTELQIKVRAGEVPADTLVWCEGMGDWKAINTVTELSAPPTPTTPDAGLPPYNPMAYAPKGISTTSGPVDLSPGSVFNAALEIFKVHWLMLTLTTLVYGVIVSAAVGIPVLGWIACWLVGGFMTVGVWKVILSAVDGRTPEIGDMFKDIGDFKNILMTGLVYLVIGIMSVIGFLFLVVPGMIVQALFGFWALLVVDGRSKDFASLGDSLTIAKPHLVPLLVLLLVSFLILFVGLLCLFIGIYPATALVYTMWAIVYRRLVPPSSTVG
ncbi:MAG: DUF4339 domain-containing protein [Verrucomicrobiae bacterium]|nr:DUF4339 domain-containing protein [Verrucomicrobiae bacterium]